MSEFLANLRRRKEELGEEENYRQGVCRWCRTCNEMLDSTEHLTVTRGENLAAPLKHPRPFLVFKYATSYEQLKEIVQDYTEENVKYESCLKGCIECGTKSIGKKEDDVKLGTETAYKLKARRKWQSERIGKNAEILTEKARQQQMIAAENLRKAKENLGV